MSTISTKERRRFPRLEIGGTVTIVYNGRGSTATLADISVAGVSLRTTASPAVGDHVILHITGLGRLEAEVRRVVGDRVGLSFVTDSREQWNLVKSLAKILS